MTPTFTMRQEPARVARAPTRWLAGLHVGGLLAFVPCSFTGQALLVCLILHGLTAGPGIGLTYHRPLTHHGFATRTRRLGYVMTTLGCCASEGWPVGWVADHREHQAHADGEEDVHGLSRGSCWAHLHWWMTPGVAIRQSAEYLRKGVPDLHRDPAHRFFDRIPFLFALLMFAGMEH